MARFIMATDVGRLGCQNHPISDELFRRVPGPVGARESYPKSRDYRWGRAWRPAARQLILWQSWPFRQDQESSRSTRGGLSRADTASRCHILHGFFDRAAPTVD